MDAPQGTSSCFTIHLAAHERARDGESVTWAQRSNT